MAHAHQQSLSTLGHLLDRGGEHRSTRDRAQTSETHHWQSTSAKDLHVARHFHHLLVQLRVHSTELVSLRNHSESNQHYIS